MLTEALTKSTWLRLKSTYTLFLITSGIFVIMQPHHLIQLKFNHRLVCSVSGIWEQDYVPISACSVSLVGMLHMHILQQHLRRSSFAAGSTKIAFYRPATWVFFQMASSVSNPSYTPGIVTWYNKTKVTGDIVQLQDCVYFEHLEILFDKTGYLTLHFWLSSWCSPLRRCIVLGHLDLAESGT